MKNYFNLFLASIYFFFNTIGLPAPITFTSLLSLIKIREVFRTHLKAMGIIAVGLAVFACTHISMGVVISDYMKSSAFFGLLLFSGFAVYEYLKSPAIRYQQIFEWMSIGSLLLLIFSLFFLNTRWEELLWKSHQFVGDGVHVRRYFGLSYEPSHLALTLSPIFLYFLLSLLQRPNWKKLGFLAAVSLPIALTFSFGFIASLVVVLIFMALTLLLTSRKFQKLLLIPVVLTTIGFAVMISFPNPFSERVEYILKGSDTSVNGRTTEAFMLAYRCAETKSIWFGIGTGQVKFVGEEIMRPYYAAMDPVGYSKENWPVMSIPNSLAETLAMFGIFGVLLKIGFQIFCFIKFKIYNNYFNLSVFFFIFFYQMMGSFILSSTEIIMWAFAFAKIFPELDVKNKPLTMNSQ